jgi:glycerol-3-phosphate dehydrogenase subunit B
VVAPRGHLRFDAGLVAGGLGRLAPLGAPRAAVVRVDLFMWEEATLARPHELARLLEMPGAAESAGELLRRSLPAGATAALFPPVLGLSPESRVPERIAAAAGLPVAETLSDVPSVPGLRLQRAIEARLAAAGVAVLRGDVEQARGPGAPAVVAGREVVARGWVLATGRFVGGGIVRRGTLREPLLGLPVRVAQASSEAGAHLSSRPAASLTSRDGRATQPLLSAGVAVDEGLRPLGPGGRPVSERLFAAGSVIGGHEQASDGTGLGVAVLTGYLAGRAAAGGTLSLVPAPGEATA